METTHSSRKTYLDVLRVLASFLVCYNHTNGYSLFLHQEANGSILSWCTVFLSSVTTTNIPLFFMISGALLLGKEESYRTLWQKRISRILVLLFCASAGIYLLAPSGPLSVMDFARKLTQGTVTVSYWYLYAYLGYLIFLPILRKIAHRITLGDILLLTGLRTFFIPLRMSLNFLLGYWGMEELVISQSLHIPLIGYDSFFCPLMGYYLCCKADFRKLPKGSLLWCGAVFLGANLLSSLVTYAEGLQSGFTDTYNGMWRYLSAMAVFAAGRYLLENVRMPRKLEDLFRFVSSASIGIYLFEPLALRYLGAPFFSRVPWNPIILIPASALWCVICMTVGACLTYGLRKIPGVADYL